MAVSVDAAADARRVPRVAFDLDAFDIDAELLRINDGDDPRVAGSTGRANQRLRRLPLRQQVALLLDLLPPVLCRVPYVDWDRFPTPMLYTLGWGALENEPIRPTLALAAGVLATHCLRGHVVGAYILQTAELWRELRRRYDLAVMTDMTYEKWVHFAQDEIAMLTYARAILHYQAVANTHLQEWYQRLSSAEQAGVAPFLLPLVPVRYVDRHIPWKQIVQGQRQRRKAKTDVLAPLGIVLVALMLERKKAAEHFVTWYRQQVARVRTGELGVPSALTYEGVEFDVNRDAQSVAEVHWIRRKVKATFTMWTPSSYIRDSVMKGDLSPDQRRLWRHFARRSGAPTNESIFSSEIRDEPFLQFEHKADPTQVPWWLPVVQEGVIIHRSARSGGARSRGGLGGPESVLATWLGKWNLRSTCVEPESLYRGVLYGSAIGVLGLTTTARLGELLQASADRFEDARPYIVKDDDGKPIIDPQTGEPQLDFIFLQRWLPKGRGHENERIRYNVSVAIDLLLEMGASLKTRHHGAIPIVRPSSERSEVLKPERHLFQWNESIITDTAANLMLRLVTAGLRFADVDGKRFDVTTHLLRHVSATVHRHDLGVPAEVLAEMMGHTLLPDGDAPQATGYYSLMPEEQRIDLRHRALLRMKELADTIMRRPIDADAEYRQLVERCIALETEVLERYHTYHPVLFGHCGCAELCVRGTRRELCIGCALLIPRPEYEHRVDVWIRAYGEMVEKLNAAGNESEIREYQRLLDGLHAIKRQMELLKQAERRGDLTLLPGQRDGFSPGSVLALGSAT
jgi:hypothetical protein